MWAEIYKLYFVQCKNNEKTKMNLFALRLGSKMTIISDFTYLARRTIKYQWLCAVILSTYMEQVLFPLNDETIYNRRRRRRLILTSNSYHYFRSRSKYSRSYGSFEALAPEVSRHNALNCGVSELYTIYFQRICMFF